jgi:hypothetical protein
MATWTVHGISLVLVAVLGVPADAQSQTTLPPTSGSTQSSTSGSDAIQAASTTPNFDRIRDALSRPAAITFDDGRVKFYSEVRAKWPTFEELARGYDLRNGPTARGNPMTHQEFLNMVTPREMYSSVGFRASEMVQLAVVNAVAQIIVKRGLEAIGKARDEREKQAIRDQIERELAALKGRK